MFVNGNPNEIEDFYSVPNCPECGLAMSANLDKVTTMGKGGSASITMSVKFECRTCDEYDDVPKCTVPGCVTNRHDHG